MKKTHRPSRKTTQERSARATKMISAGKGVMHPQTKRLVNKYTSVYKTFNNPTVTIT
jgi:hypothetical protein